MNRVYHRPNETFSKPSESFFQELLELHHVGLAMGLVLFSRFLGAEATLCQQGLVGSGALVDHFIIALEQSGDFGDAPKLSVSSTSVSVEKLSRRVTMQLGLDRFDLRGA
jgi:hypothetical protein